MRTKNSRNIAFFAVMYYLRIEVLQIITPYGDFVNRLFYVAILVICTFFFSVSGSSAGNLSLIEKRLIELDQLNKQAIQQAGNIPENGSIEIKATVTPASKPMGKDADWSKQKSFSFNQVKVMSIDQKYPYTVQISSSRSQDQCYRVANMLRRAGYPAFTASLIFKDQTTWHRIFIGSFSDKTEAETVKQSLEHDEISDGLVRSMPYALQVGDFGTLESLSSLKKKVEEQKYLPYTSYARDTATDETKVRLLVGAFETREDTASLAGQLREQGLKVRVVNR